MRDKNRAAFIGMVRSRFGGLRATKCHRARRVRKDDSERHTGAFGPLQSSCRARTEASRASPPNGRRARRKYCKQAMAAPRSRLPTIRLPESRDQRPNSPDASHHMHQLSATSTSAQRLAGSLGHTARAGGILRAADTSIGGSSFAPRIDQLSVSRRDAQPAMSCAHASLPLPLAMSQT